MARYEDGVLRGQEGVRVCVSYHNRDVQQVHVFVQDVSRLLGRGHGCLYQLLRGAHGHVEIQRSVLQPLLLPMHLRDVCPQT